MFCNNYRFPRIKTLIWMCGVWTFVHLCNFSYMKFAANSLLAHCQDKLRHEGSDLGMWTFANIPLKRLAQWLQNIIFSPRTVIQVAAGSQLASNELFKKYTSAGSPFSLDELSDMPREKERENEWNKSLQLKLVVPASILAQPGPCSKTSQKKFPSHFGGVVKCEKAGNLNLN